MSLQRLLDNKKKIYIIQGVEFLAYRRKFAFFTVRIRPKIIISAQNDLGKQVK